jgi:hypothetical protein
MSIPERLYRLAKGKISEIRDLFDQQEEDVELDPEVIARRERAQSRKDARRELDDHLDVPPARSASNSSAAPLRPPSTTPLRTPEEIAPGARLDSRSTGNAPLGTGSPTQVDPLEPHYRLLGLEPGADYAAVQAVYEKLAARLQPERFPADSPEAREAQDIRNRLESSYKILREALDPTARRINMLEL